MRERRDHKPGVSRLSLYIRIAARTSPMSVFSSRRVCSAQFSESALLIQGSTGVAELVTGGRDPTSSSRNISCNEFNVKQGESAPKCTYGRGCNLGKGCRVGWAACICGRSGI